MDASMRLFAALLLGLALLALAFLRPHRLRAVGVEAASFAPAERDPVVLESPPEVSVMAYRIAAKIRVADRVLGREMDLFEAAAHFRHLNRLRPACVPPPSADSAGRTEEEKSCRQVIAWVGAHQGGSTPSSVVGQAVAELEAALTDRLRRDGRIELPEPR